MIDRIAMRNFRRIREADMEIRDGITVITGENGTGKSTIIEAVTFCLYGEVKDGTKKDSIRSSFAGDERTVVSVDFTVRDGHYRCQRAMSPKGTVAATLTAYEDDADYDAAGSPFEKSQSGKSAATGASGVTLAVTDVLGVSCKGFLASFVAKQKELDALASLTKENRKKFFLDLLDYSQLDKMKKSISEEIRVRQRTYDDLMKQGLDPDSIGTEIERHKGNLERQKGRVAKGSAMVAEQEETVNRIIDGINRLAASVDAAGKARRALEHDGAALERERARGAKLRGDIEAKEPKAAGYVEGKSVSGELMDATERLRRSESAVAARKRYEQAKGGADELRQSIGDAEARIAELDRELADRPDLDAATDRSRDASAALTTAASEIKRLQRDRKRIAGLIDSVESGDIAECPTCGTKISDEAGRRHLGAELARIDEDLAHANEARDAAKAEDAEAAKALADCKRRQAAYMTKQAERRSAETMLRSNRSQLSGTEEMLEKAREESERTASDVLDPKDAMMLQDRVMRLRREADGEEARRKAFYDLRDLRAKLEACEARCDELAGRVEESSAVVESARDAEERNASLVRDRAAAAAKLTQLRDLLTKVQKSVATEEATIEGLNRQLETAQAAAQQMHEHADRIQAYEGAMEVVEALRVALPSRIAPRLSAEASRLVNIATEGMYPGVDIDESYDVTVFTADGPRPMSHMSGGEADVISLCIRIAISQLILEATAGGKRTMLLDEVFGALDDERKQSVCEAIRNIGEELGRIVIVTHVDEIKDTADWTYAVERDDEGVSSVTELRGAGAMSRMIEAQREAHADGR